MAKQGIFSLLHSAVDITSDVMADVVRLYRLHNGILSSELVPSIPSCWGGGGGPVHCPGRRRKEEGAMHLRRPLPMLPHVS